MKEFNRTNNHKTTNNNRKIRIGDCYDGYRCNSIDDIIASILAEVIKDEKEANESKRPAQTTKVSGTYNKEPVARCINPAYFVNLLTYAGSLSKLRANVDRCIHTLSKEDKGTYAGDVTKEMFQSGAYDLRDICVSLQDSLGILVSELERYYGIGPVEDINEAPMTKEGEVLADIDEFAEPDDDDAPSPEISCGVGEVQVPSETTPGIKESGKIGNSGFWTDEMLEGLEMALEDYERRHKKKKEDDDWEDRHQFYRD